MFSGTVDTPRPIPPAKARRATAALQKLSSTPPPAYGSPFTFPSRNVSLHGQGHDSELGVPDSNDPSIDLGHLPSPPPEDGEDWMSERSREELKDLLVKADGIIRERENELGLASAVAKGLYQSNVVLKSKHQQLLARLPLSPVPSSSSPELPYAATFDSHSRANSVSVVSSSSDSALGLIKSPRPTSLYIPRQGGQTRKIAIATADISLLADQNAELLEKLEKLEAEATSADHAGRRELKRLEKEITFLREALEKTQAKSEELEEKVQDAVGGEAWRRKKEREAKFRAMRGLGRQGLRGETEDAMGGVRNFAPTGSRFGGPSDRFSFFPSESSSSSSSSDGGVFFASAAPPPAPTQQPDQSSLISQLLVKVQELEQTNARILQQQSETATQLSVVQRDTAHIAKVYETLADTEAVEVALELDDDAQGLQHDYAEKSGEGGIVIKRKESKGAMAPSNSSTSNSFSNANANLRKSLSRSTMRFMSLRRSIEEEMAFNDDSNSAARGNGCDDGDNPGTFVIHPDVLPSVSKNRKSVMGLFDDVDPSHSYAQAHYTQEIEEHKRDDEDNNYEQGNANPIFPSESSTSSWSEGPGYSNSFWSSSSLGGNPDDPSGLPADVSGDVNVSGRLSPLHFFSPALGPRFQPPRVSTDVRAGQGQDSAVGSASPSSDLNNRHLDIPSVLPTGRPTLQAELINLGSLADSNGSGMAAPTPSTSFNHHFRASSLYDLSQISVPPTPSPASRTTNGSGGAGGKMFLDELETESKSTVESPSTTNGDSKNADPNALKLSIEPPTPHKHGYGRVATAIANRSRERRTFPYADTYPSPISHSGTALADAVKSPRLKLISDTLKSRTNRWVEKRLNRTKSKSRSTSGRRSPNGQRQGRRELESDDEDLKEVLQEEVIEVIELDERETRKRPSAIRGRLSNAVDNLIEGFNGFSTKALGGSRSRSNSSRASSSSGSESRDREGLSVDMRVIRERPHSPQPLSLPTSASSEESSDFHLRHRQREHHKRKPSAPLLIYTDSSSSKEIATTVGNSNGSTMAKNETENPGLLLQVWMWLQFAVVVLVFVYAMAKRGPGSVLTGGAEDGGGRKAVAKRRG